MSTASTIDTDRRVVKLERPIVLGVVGDSASGKTTISEGIAEILGPERVTVICVDDYHRYDREERSANDLSALDPRCNFIEVIEQHLGLLRQGQAILKPVYNHESGTLERPEYIQPTDFIIAEGLLGYHTRAMRESYDVKLYLDPQEEIRIGWKVQRDTAKRGYSRSQVLAQLNKRRHDSPAFIHPQRTFADIVVSFHSHDQPAEAPEKLNVRHILRPTLPHPDFTPILDGSSTQDIHYELIRDIDGKPVDVLEIEGSITDDRARHLEDLIWDLLPEVPHLRDGLGAIEHDGCESVSHPLALSQLLVAYHMVKAAHGVHAV